MKTPLFAVVTNRGTFKAGWIVPFKAETQTAFEPCHTERPPQIHWVRELSFVHPRQHLEEMVSDMAGAFAATASGGGKPVQLGSSPSETHWRIEADRRVVSDLVEEISRVLHEQKPARWILSVPADLHSELVKSLPETCRDNLQRVIPKNLADVPIQGLLDHFLESTPLR
jgi:hypothetical protein